MAQRGTSSAMALPGKDCSLPSGAQRAPYGPRSPPQLTRAPGALQILMAMNTGGQGRGGEGTGHTGRQGRRADGPKAWHTAGLLSIFVQKQGREAAWDGSRVSLPPLAAWGWGLQAQHPSRDQE